MCNLNNEELILLDNLIYLEWDAHEDETVYELAEYILKEDNLQKIMDKNKDCIETVTKEEWQQVLKQILNKPDFKEIKIENVENHKSGIRSACFVDNEDNALVVFRGTMTANEWDDNGEGAYKYDTKQQINALQYIEKLKYNNIVVTGHSKGGNKAQYAAVLSPKVIKCISINGQGFSNEFIKKYNEQISRNKSKIVAINSKYDYVNCLFNSIAGESHYIKTDFQINPLFYHKANILLNEDGSLKEEVSRSIFAKIINDFSVSLISDLPDEIKSLTVDGLIGAIEIILCRNNNSDKIIKIAGSILVMLTFGKYFKIKETFILSYTILQILVIPLLFWSDFINAEETKSNQSLKKILNRIDKKSNYLIEKLNIIEGDKNPLTRNIAKSISNLISKLKVQTLEV